MPASRVIAGIAVLFLCVLACEKPNNSRVLPAFPGAEGFGALTPGGRGGRVIKVTNLNTGGPGSMQEACSAEGPRIVVFDVSGVIPGDVMIENGQISILGQTAPGAGITIRGMLKTPNDTTRMIEDIVVRFIRVRPPAMTGDQADALQFNRVRRTVIDHCSISWSTDECLGLYCARDLTVQWCAVEESDTAGHWKGRHNFGLLNGPEGAHLTVHHTLFAHHSRRSPAVANAPADIVNNVVYDFRDGFLHDNPTNDSTFNIVGNYYKAGPSSRAIYPFCFDDSASYYLRDNYIHGVGLIQDPWAERNRHPGLAAYADKGHKAQEPSPCPAVTTQPPEEAYSLVLASAGCLPRDWVSLRTVAEVRDSTGSWGRREPADFMEGLTPATPPADTDSDGMPDEWEKTKGLDPRDGSDCSKVLESGYTAIEVYANELARNLIENSTALDLPAFPGAEGFGAATGGGRGGRVIKVTNLNSSGPGSLQAACSAEGPRIVVFDVSGVIPGDVTIEHGQISLLGQTAPGAGITLRGMLKTPYGRGLPKVEDIVVRFMRFRPDSNLTLNQGGDALQISNARRVMLDHCSFAWASDETIDVFQADDVTVQWCTVEDGDTLGHEEGVHNYGLIQGPDGQRITVHHNLFAHQKRRNPAIANGPADIVNNVVYNFRDGFLHDNPTNGGVFNLVGNYYKRGPNDPQIFPFCFAKKTKYYLRDNFIYGLGLVQDPWAEKDRHPGLRYYARYGARAEKPAICPPVTTQPPEEAYSLVLAKAGCFPRDFVTSRVLREVEEGNGSWGRRGVPDLMVGLTPAVPSVDTDSDGMPDEWEQARGLDPKDGADCVKVMPSGYTAIEEYANERAEEMIEKN